MVNLYSVKATSLNIRSSPKVEDSNKITSVPQNQVIVKLGIADDDAWWKILTIKDGQPLEGFVASRFLEPAPRLVQAIGWFKGQFGDKINATISGTPFSLDLLVAIAVQETYYIWGTLYNKLSIDEVLQLCTGDTLDAPRRSAFPENKAELLAYDKGDEMFAIARAALEAVANFVPSFKRVADSSPNKFCRGYGIFQLDLQFFKNNPNYFLQKKWYSFDECLAQCVNELKAAMRRAYGSSKMELTDEEKVYVAIAYNRGSVDFSKKFKQGFRDESGKYYGEYVWEYLQLAKSVP
ncbi:SH3 domain-containing protein [Leptolyngbya sp. GB1-A1]|uniref:SH3 domain-containing protein n=1 Tax=Leptolyngbya sp. GB1-A1 TaxID=2933908 RepID=UPI003296D97C